MRRLLVLIARLANIGVFDTVLLDTRVTTPAPPGTDHVRVRGANVNRTGSPSHELAVVVP